MSKYEKEDLIINRIEKKKDANGNSYFTLSLIRDTGKKNKLAVAKYKTNVFSSGDTGALYDALVDIWADYKEADKLKENDGVKYVSTPKDEDGEPLVVAGSFAKLAVDPHYYFEKGKDGKMKIDKNRILRFVRLTALDVDTIENQLESYLKRVPDNAWIAGETKDASDDEDDD